MKPFTKMLLALLFFGGANQASFAQAPVFNSVTANTTTPAKFDKFELNVNLTAGFTNPYNYNDIAVQCIFSAPSGKKDTVDGFYMQDYSADANNDLTTSGAASFRVRYAPVETGHYTFIVSCTNGSGSAAAAAQSFNCGTSNAAGFIRKNSSNYLGFDNGQQYFPIGENMGWQDNNVITDYSTWLTKLAGNGGNFIRVWMSSWAFALEWKNGVNNYAGLKNYKQTSAWYLDWLLDYCHQKGVYIMLTLNNHGQVSTNVNPEWASNPYNVANGGPAANTWNFFTDDSARAFHKNRLRYIIARYGYSQNIQSWELFNEVEWTDQYDDHKAEVKNWHQEMASYLKSKDVYKHLVSTSFAHDVNDPATWNIPEIDFTQTHYYVSTPSLESVLASGTQTYLDTYHKPTLNGEFGLGPDGATLIADDAAGVHVHNTLWGSAFSGAMGSAMTWWWDTYIEPKDLYPYFKPISTLVGKINFKNDAYSKAAVSTSGGGSSDLSVSPGAGFSKAPAALFTIDESGNITPGASQLANYIFGSIYNTQNRNPPTFHVNFPVSGQFKVVITSGSQGTLPKVNISVDGAEVLNTDVTAGSTYTVNVAAGTHDIKVDNSGTDWFNVSNYVFTNIGSATSAYVVKAAGNLKAAGWVLNKQYNWAYLKSNSNTAPPAVQGSNLSIAGMENGNYTVQFYNTITGSLTNSISVPVSNGSLAFPLPDIAWDLAFTAQEGSVLPIKVLYFRGAKVNTANQLDYNLAEAAGVKRVYIERSADGVKFETLSLVSAQWPSIAGSHQFVDNHPIKGTNFYRLRMEDADGKLSYSGIVKIVNDLTRVTVLPNPFTNTIQVNLGAGNYHLQLADQSGKVVIKKEVSMQSTSQQVSLATSQLSSGMYFLKITDGQGVEITSQSLRK